MGPVGHVYFAAPKSDEQRRALARRLVQDGRVPGVLMRTADDAVAWFHARGETPVPGGVPPLLPHPAPLRDELARDLARLCRNADAGDLVLVGWSPWSGITRSFAPERGSHGGFGPHETQGFVILPAPTPLPAEAEHFIRPEALRAAARYHIGRTDTLVPRPRARRAADLRLMTYNVHGCAGMDGRVSPRRIARVIKARQPDVVALQELDLGRRRSRAEDQAALIAGELGMHVVFCPTVTRGEEHYGHAILSLHPLQLVKRMRLPHDPKSWWQEPRAAIWVRLEVAGRTVSIVTTHLGLGAGERVAQVTTLLGAEWIGSIPAAEPVVLCGDFNALPGSLPYRLAAARLHDVQRPDGGHRPAATFSSLQPLVRLDHIFTSSHFGRTRVHVVRNDQTRVASDHLPLVADLRFDARVDAPAQHPAAGG
jgi:endonuclease/exonuclease/phosphatase family metal-dependent hydrolase